ncbi:hypothetical protein [Campylobacter helveticus]|uniref:hypothetical protein n=1 Tax=Campylobacter helveticus TaxID=28898 RepID=UPI00214A7C22|nr:hypothetical protein [Campylobacter helveticus]MCR2064558.1 hypothetical protein [Campylobacter helveticus]
MSEKVLEIFKLCERLVELLGDKEAIADLKILLIRHPEMFKSKEEVKEVIERVVSEPDIIVDARRDENYLVFKALKALSDTKMGDVIIKNQDGINEIFHTNKKKISEFTRFAKKANNLIDGEDAQPPHPDENQVRATGISSMRSSIIDNNIPQPLKESQAKNNNLKAKVSELLREQENISSMPRAKDFNKDFQKDLEESFGMKLEDLKDESKNKPTYMLLRKR